MSIIPTKPQLEQFLNFTVPSSDVNKYVAQMCTQKGNLVKIVDVNGDTYFGLLDRGVFLHETYKLIPDESQSVHSVIVQRNHGTNKIELLKDYIGVLKDITQGYKINDPSIIPKPSL